MSLFGQDNGSNRRQELMEDQAEKQTHQNLQSKAVSHALQNQPVLNQNGQIREEYLSHLVDSGIDESSASLLKDLLTRDMVLSNLDSAETNEIRWLTRLVQKNLEALHPPEGSVIQGEYRAFLSDDEEDRLAALNDRQRLLINEAVMVVVARVARSTDGWQQEELGKVYAVSEAKQEKDEKKGRILG